MNLKKRAIKILISLVLFIISLLMQFSNIWINSTIYIISYIIVGGDIVKKAIRNIFRGKVFDENFLMTIATIGAFSIGEFPEGVAVMLFYQVGELFQGYAVDKSRKSISSLMDLRPDFANVRIENKINKVEPEEVNIGQIIIVKPGEKVPLDGKVVKGSSMLDTSSITGESVPRKVQLGDNILSGCINQNGVLEIQVTKQFKESTVNKILDLVENASNKKSRSEDFISRFAKYYTPVVVIIALILAIIPPLILDMTRFIDWLYRALTFLVVSCPCALVISIPLSFFGGIGGASKMGILVKGSNYLEALSDVSIMVFDKTGTLTHGSFEVQNIETIGISKEELIKLVAHAESYSNHPISLSLKNAYNNEIDNSIVSKTQELPGLGIIAKVSEKELLIGNEKLMEENNIQYNQSSEIGTIIYVAIDKKFVGYIVIADKIKEDSKQAIRKLKSNNVKIVMLTGDKKVIGESVANELQIDTVYTELLPDGKAHKLEEIMNHTQHMEKVAFVGDGANDAPVLALSDIGIAMGGLGSDSAIEAADIVIMTDEPSKIVNAIQISRKTMKIVKENIICAILIKVAVLVLSAFGLSNMWQAVFADVGVSFIAILNSLRVLKGIKTK